MVRAACQPVEPAGEERQNGIIPKGRGYSDKGRVSQHVKFKPRRMGELAEPSYVQIQASPLRLAWLASRTARRERPIELKTTQNELVLRFCL